MILTAALFASAVPQLHSHPEEKPCHTSQGRCIDISMNICGRLIYIMDGVNELLLKVKG